MERFTNLRYWSVQSYFTIIILCAQCNCFLSVNGATMTVNYAVATILDILHNNQKDLEHIVRFIVELGDCFAISDNTAHTISISVNKNSVIHQRLKINRNRVLTRNCPCSLQLLSHEKNTSDARKS